MHATVSWVRRFALAGLAGTGLLALACSGAAQEAPAPRAPLVEAVQARAGGLPSEEMLHGVVRAENQVSVRAEISARVAEVAVRSGDPVERGQLLVRLEDDELRDQLRRAEADVALAVAGLAEESARAAELEARLNRLRRLADDDLISPQELETLTAQLDATRAAERAAAARVEQARADVEERRSALAKLRVVAPVSGRVGERRVEVGMLAAPDTVLFRVGNLSRVVIDVTLSERMLGRIRAGQPLRVMPRDAADEPIDATLTRFSPFLEEDSFTTTGEIEVDNASGRLLPGMFVDVQLLFDRGADATLVPVSAVWTDPESGAQGVFVVDDVEGLANSADRSDDAERRVRFVELKVLAEGRASVGVEGVEPGAWVVTIGQHLLRREMRELEAGDASVAKDVVARVRPATWERISALQELQREDLLEGFLDKQQRIARVLGAEIPESEDVVRRALKEEAGAAAEGR